MIPVLHEVLDQAGATLDDVDGIAVTQGPGLVGALLVALQTAKALGMYTAGHIPYAVGLDGILAEGMDETAHIEELLPEFLALDRDKKLTPEEWLPYIVEAALLQWDFTSGDFQADFETDNLETMVRISD